MKLRFQFRVLPAAIAGAGLLLAGKLGMLMVGYDSPAVEPASARQVAALEAISPAAGKPAEDKPKPAAGEKDKPAKSTADGTAGQAGDKAKSEKSDKTAKPDTSPKTDSSGKTDQTAVTGGERVDAKAEEQANTGARLGLDDENFDPMMLSRAEIELLQGLSKRRAALEQRERDFALKEQTLAAAEEKLDAKVKALEELKKTVETMLAQRGKEEEERLRSLVKIYESMKPKEAASILEGLDPDTLLDVIERMKESKSASILALLNPSRAKMITEELLARRRQPKSDATS